MATEKSPKAKKNETVELVTNIKFLDIEANVTRNKGDKFTVSKERAKTLTSAKDRKNRQLVTVVEMKK